MKEYDIYLFDADGTLTDTAELIYRCYENTCKAYGVFDLSREKVISTIGIPLRTQMELFVGKLSDEEYQRAQKIHMDFQFAKYKEYLTVFDGVHETLEALKAEGKKLAVVTSRRMDSLGKYLDYVNVLHFFDELITPESTKNHKPHPEPVYEALSKFAKGSALFIGDSRYDIEAGNAAGVDTAFVSWSVSGLGDSTAVPTYTIDHMTDILHW